MVEKYFEGKVPKAAPGADSGLKRKAIELADELEMSVPRLDFTAALTKIWEIINLANKFIEDSKPWVLVKEKKEGELSLVISSLLETLRTVANSIAPFMPQTAENIYKQLGGKEGNKIAKAAPLFPRIEV